MSAAREEHPPDPPSALDAARRRRPGLGARGEQLAFQHLDRRGYALVAANARTRFGELDLIVRNDDTLVFVEVKTRRSGGRSGGPLEAITQHKVRQVRALARAWLAETPDRPRGLDLRFDAIGVVLDHDDTLISLDHLEGAF